VTTPSAMATVELSFTALPAHVRTARLVAAAVARRAGVDEAVLDEVRLAVGEACSRAVDLHRQSCPDEPVLVRLTDGADTFCVEVVDRAPVDPLPAADVLAELTTSQDLDEALPANVELAVIMGLVDDVQVAASRDGLAVRMRWPAAPVGCPAG
jgi:serine/threonine-protein kinase RsbW